MSEAFPPSTTRFRDALRAIVPWWLSDRPSSGKVTGFRFLWSMIAPLDVLAQRAVEAILTRIPGYSDATALPILGRSRLMIRGIGETDAEYAARLATWIDKARLKGSQEGIARAIHEFFEGRPKVRVVNRAGQWFTINADGTTETHNEPWDWDSVSHPERASWWSDQWVIVYVGDVARWQPGSIGSTIDAALWLAQREGNIFWCGATLAEADAILGELAATKSAHSRIRAVIFTADPDRYDPEDSGTCPDGTWGAWGNMNNTHRQRGSRPTDDQIWEPR